MAEKLRIYVDFPTPPDVLQLLQQGTTGHELIFPSKPVTSVLAKAEPDPSFATAEVAFGQPDVEAIRNSSSLRFLQVSSSGITRYDNAEFRALTAERGIAVANSASVYNEACAVHALSFLLGQARHLPVALASRAPNGSPDWNALRQSSGTLRGETVLILGYGAIGERLAELLEPFGAKLLAYRRRPRGNEPMRVISSANDLSLALGEADHVMNILPESAETRGFFDAARFAGMKQGACFYNIGRGATVEQDALLQALRSGHLAAAWLDVSEPEPLPPEHPLWAEPNCFITPHVAGGHHDEAKTLVRHFNANFARFVRGEPLLDRVM